MKLDTGKGSVHILHRTKRFGCHFKLLGLEFDVSLRMGHAVSILAREAGWPLQAVVRPKRFFTTKQIFNLYKCQVLSLIESGVCGYDHTSANILATLDRIQTRLPRETGVSAEDALTRFDLAPLQSKRDIAMLGMLHRTMLGETPQQL